MNESPTSLCPQKNVGGHRIEYHNLMETCQGGPEVGNLSIDGEMISGLSFGGPFIEDDGAIYIPQFKRKFISSGFVLCKIDLSTKEIEEKGKMCPLIYLKSIENNVVTYFEDYTKTKESTIKV